MRGLVLACVLAACGNDAGLLLDVHPGDPSVVRVDVLLPSDQPGQYMGVPTGVQPPAQGPKITGVVYAVVDRTSGSVDNGGALRVLLTPGAVTAVPAILVLGYDANQTPIRYAVVTDPSGAILLPHTTSAHLIVDLEPITTVPLSGAADAPASPRLVRWDGATFDDASARCFGILTGTGSNRAGIFFGPDDDLDCDHAEPECDKTWYMRVRGASTCATTMPPPADADTLDACRIGNSAGCRDGDPTSMVCAAQTPAICVPAEVCDQCGDSLDPSCTQQQMTDLNTSHIECTIVVHTDTQSGSTTFCGTATATVAMDTRFGHGYTCSGLTAFADPMMPASGTAPDLALDAAPADKLTVACQGGTTELDFAVANPVTTTLDPSLPETQSALLFGVHSSANSTVTRLLALPIHVTYVDVGPQLCDSASMQCDLVLDANTGADDPLWHCAGG